MNILELNNRIARKFLLKEESYFNFDLPQYFEFSNLLNTLSKKINGKTLSNFYSKDKVLRPRAFDDVNYTLLSNKDGKYAWRPFQLIHPALYVSLVHEITEENNWETIRERLRSLRSSNIECVSVPVVSRNKNSDRAEQVTHWWEEVEQKSISESLDYEQVFHTDIVDCYGSIYTHSIAWALHGKEFAKAKENRNDSRLIGNIIDNHLQDMSYGQTNGIPQGSVLMDFIAEIVLLYIDSLLAVKLKHIGNSFKIIRYRDDYRVFVNNSQIGEEIIKSLTEVLCDFGMKLNAQKTQHSTHPTHAALKTDKLFWMTNCRESKNLVEELYIISSLAERFPNSGTVSKLMKQFYIKLSNVKGSQKKVSEVVVLTSIVTDIAFRNPRVYPVAAAIISELVGLLKGVEPKKELLKRISARFAKLPNTGLIKIWLQRITLKLDKDIQYDEDLCKKVKTNETQIWRSDWLSDEMQKTISTTQVINEGMIRRLKPEIALREFDLFTTEYY